MGHPALQSLASLHRILILDDEPLVLNGLRETLSREGYHVTTTTNPFGALEELRHQIFSVIISDHYMPGVTGLEFLAQAKEIQPNASRILITAVLSLDTVIEAINQGEIYRFIVKPWLREELLATVKNAVQRYELIDSNSVLQTRSAVINRELNETNRTLQLQLSRATEQCEALAGLNRTLTANFQHSVQLGLRLLQAFHPGLGHRARRVQEICHAMADTLQFNPMQREILDLSAWFHDLGFIAIPRDFIRRWETNPESFSGDELKIIQSHCVLGQSLIKFEQHLEDVGFVIRAHHERFDGQGYPDGLKGEEIPWLARLLAVAVAYTESKSLPTEAVEEIKLGSGGKFDPEAVRVFLRVAGRLPPVRREREISLAELQPGMVLAKGIYTPSGIMIVPDGQPLDDQSIGQILRQNLAHPLDGSLLVYC